jgi:hypothetical protein
MADSGKPDLPSREKALRDKTVDQLLVDVFQTTGQKITSDDPIVVAALFQSQLMKAASRDAAQTLLTTANLVNEAQAKNTATLEATVHGAFQKLNDGAKKITETELASVTRRFLQSSTEALESIRDQAVKATPGYLSKRVIWVGTISLLVGASLGAAAVVLARPTLTDEQVRLLHNGLLLDAAWPKLPKLAKDVIQPPGQLSGRPQPSATN